MRLKKAMSAFLGCKDKKKTAAQQGRFPGDPKVSEI